MQYLSTQKVSKGCVRSAVTGSKNVTRSLTISTPSLLGKKTGILSPLLGREAPVCLTFPVPQCSVGQGPFTVVLSCGCLCLLGFKERCFFPETVETDCQCFMVNCMVLEKNEHRKGGYGSAEEVKNWKLGEKQIMDYMSRGGIHLGRSTAQIPQLSTAPSRTEACSRVSCQLSCTQWCCFLCDTHTQHTIPPYKYHFSTI